jgi:hypothetical protein
MDLVDMAVQAIDGIKLQASAAKEAFKRRKELSEPSFGIIKEQMCLRRFLLRGLKNTKAETIMVAIAFNLRILYKAWLQRLNKIWKTFPLVGGYNFAYMPFFSVYGI